jgi:hypothetical protein
VRADMQRMKLEDIDIETVDVDTIDEMYPEQKYDNFVIQLRQIERYIAKKRKQSKPKSTEAIYE